MTTHLSSIDRESKWDHQDHGEGADDKLVGGGEEYHTEPVEDYLLRLSQFSDCVYRFITHAPKETYQEEGLNATKHYHSDQLERVATCARHIAPKEELDLTKHTNLSVFFDQSEPATYNCPIRTERQFLVHLKLCDALFSQLHNRDALIKEVPG